MLSNHRCNRGDEEGCWHSSYKAFDRRENGRKQSSSTAASRHKWDSDLWVFLSKIAFCLLTWFWRKSLQFLVRSTTNDTTSLGCAIAAGWAEGIDLTDFSPQNRVYSVKVHHDTYLPTSTDEDRKARNKKWKMAVERSYGWATSAKTSTMTSKSPRKIHHHTSSSLVLCKLWNNLHQLASILSSLIIISIHSKHVTKLSFIVFFISRRALLDAVFDSRHTLRSQLLCSSCHVGDVHLRNLLVEFHFNHQW